MHYQVKLHNKCGDMFGNLVLSLFINAWRNTPAKNVWMLHPKDPTQLEESWAVYLATLPICLLVLQGRVE